MSETHTTHATTPNSMQLAQLMHLNFNKAISQATQLQQRLFASFTIFPCQSGPTSLVALVHTN